MQDVVTSFQRLSEQLYEERTGAAARRNAFQHLEVGSDLWAPVIGAITAQALAWSDTGMDFADALHLASSSRQGSFCTFDAKFIKAAPSDIEVLEP